MLVLVLGVKGVGKSHVLREAAKQMPHWKYEIVSYGDVMLDNAKKAGVRDREELGHLPVPRQRKIQEDAAREIRKRSENQILFLDTHGFYPGQPGQLLLPGTPDNVAKLLQPKLILLMEADPAVIYERRRKDLETGARKRNLENAALIALNQDVERVAAGHIAASQGVPLKVVDRTRSVEDTPETLADLLEALKKTFA